MLLSHHAVFPIIIKKTLHCCCEASLMNLKKSFVWQNSITRVCQQRWEIGQILNGHFI